MQGNFQRTIKMFSASLVLCYAVFYYGKRVQCPYFPRVNRSPYVYGTKTIKKNIIQYFLLSVIE